jgi:hypothetical protein
LLLCHHETSNFGLQELEEEKVVEQAAIHQPGGGWKSAFEKIAS